MAPGRPGPRGKSPALSLERLAANDPLRRKRQAIKRSQNHKFKRLKAFKRELATAGADGAPGGGGLDPDALRAAPLREEDEQDEAWAPAESGRALGKKKKARPAAREPPLQTARKAWEEARAAALEAKARKQAEIDAAARRNAAARRERMATNGKLSRRTARGQPVMRHQMDRLLAKIEAGSQPQQ